MCSHLRHGFYVTGFYHSFWQLFCLLSRVNVTERLCARREELIYSCELDARSCYEHCVR